MKYLDIDENALENSGALFTAKEIAGQPKLWRDILLKVVNEKKQLGDFMRKVLPKTQKIVLTGAGTSGYIGHSIEGAVLRKHGVPTVSVATTHLVSHPRDYFEHSENVLLISFARSGNSPESAAAVQLADEHAGECNHLAITCNPQGNLAKQPFKNSGYVFILPPEADDKSLAMTGSYSGMLLSALLINDIENSAQLQKTVDTIASYAQNILQEHLELIKRVAKLPFQRAVFLGSGPQYGTAMESHLKLQELTDGQVICKNDSYLGFRHGPKAVVDENTLVVYYFSNNAEVLRYEKDLVNAMGKGKPPIAQIGISETTLDNIEIDELIVLSENGPSVQEEYLTVPNILLGQLLGFFKSIEKGLSPDSPSQSGAISRVVKGVKIY